jgi:hypothetical protein
LQVVAEEVAVQVSVTALVAVEEQVGTQPQLSYAVKELL